jgi:hypothetical protein
MPMRPAHSIWPALALSACGFNFQSSAVVVDRRIIAMQAEPPEIIVGQSDLTQPIQLKALVVDPADAGTPQTFEWRSCLPDFNAAGNYDQVQGRCLETDATLLEKGAALLSMMAAQTLPSSTVDALTPLLGGLSSGSGGSGPPGVGLRGQGLATYLQVQLKVQPDATGKDVYGIKRVVFSTPGPGNRQPNKTPHLTALLFDDTPWEPSTPRAVTVQQCAADKQKLIDDPDGAVNGTTPQVTVCEHRITPVFDEAEAENYVVETIDTGADGKPVVLNLKERLRFGWETNNGSFTAGTTGQPDSIGPQQYDPLSTNWIEPPRIKSASVTLWVIVRDGRGGESWESRQLTLAK